MYINEDLGWNMLNSAAASKKICQLTSTYAPVNFISASQPIITSLKSSVHDNVVLPLTVTQGNIRYSFCIDRLEHNRLNIKFSACIPINVDESTVINNDLYTAKGSYCVAPVEFKTPVVEITTPKQLNLPSRDSLSRWVYDVFEENSETILWLIGDMLSDFGTKRLFILYGPGNIGKSTVVNIISMFSSHSLVQISPKYMVTSGKFNDSLPDTFIPLLASSRLAVSGDVEVTDNTKINVQTIKKCTGGDVTEHGNISVTCVMSCNKLFKYDDMSEYTTCDRIRRMVVIPTVTQRACESNNLH